MKSPFPGMDPYLERFWRDVHQGLVVYARDSIQARLPADLLARAEERVYVETEEGRYREVGPDVHVVEDRARRPGPQPAPEAGVAIEEPLVLRLSDEPAREAYLEIVEVASGNRVVTVIEFLSPSNKRPGAGQELYLRKQREVLDSRASLVEIDLTRGGRRVTSVPPEQVPHAHRTTYAACVRRGWKPLEAEIYRLPLDRKLPSIRLPLRPQDADVPLDLQSLVDQCYANGRYWTIDYRAEPVPPLEPAEAAWADALLRSKGLR